MKSLIEVSAVFDGQRKVVGYATRGGSDGAYVLHLDEEFKNAALVDVDIADDEPQADPLEKKITKKN